MLQKPEHELLIIIPAYNEEKNIGALLDVLEKPPISDIADILVINDASQDRTNAVVKRRHEPLVTHVFNLGYGSALQLGFKFAVRRNYRYVIQMDADGQHDPCNVENLYEALKTPLENDRCPDIVVGSRYLPESPEFPTGGVKKFAIRLFRGLIKQISGKRIMDPTSGLQGLSRRAFLYYSQFGHFDDQYPDANMLLQMMLLKFRVKEIPALMHTRTEGTSMHSGLKPIMYMMRMTLEIFSVWFRCSVLKIDKGIGDNETLWAEEDSYSHR